MKHYNSYMERQSISSEAHEALLNLKPGKRRSARPWTRYGALAACAALILGVGTWKRSPPDRPPQTTTPPAPALAPHGPFSQLSLLVLVVVCGFGGHCLRMNP